MAAERYNDTYGNYEICGFVKLCPRCPQLADGTDVIMGMEASCTWRGYFLVVWKFTHPSGSRSGCIHRNRGLAAFVDFEFTNAAEEPGAAFSRRAETLLSSPDGFVQNLNSRPHAAMIVFCARTRVKSSRVSRFESINAALRHTVDMVIRFRHRPGMLEVLMVATIQSAIALWPLCQL